MLQKHINLNVLQLTKFGLHVGSETKYLNTNSRSFIKGQRKKINIIDLDSTLNNSKKIIFFLRKIFLKKQKVFSSFRKIILPQRSLFLFRGRNKNGFITNKEFTKNRLVRNLKKREIIDKDVVFSLKKTMKKPPYSVSKKRRTKKIKLPAASLFDREEGNLYSILENRKKKLISILFADISNRPNIAHYSIVGNNNSFSSFSYFNKIISLCFR